MFDKKPVQLEIFSSGSGSEQKGDRATFLNRMWGYEKFILVFIGFLLVGVISFSLGMERGKRNALPAFARQPMPVKTPDLPVPVALTPVTPVAVNNALQKEEKQGILSGYTVQVASYNARVYAQKEADILKRKGFKTIILVEKGSYILVCVGNFASKEKASLSMRELKRTYKDCFVRRL